MKTNIFKFALVVGLLVVLQMIEERFSQSFTEVSWKLLVSIDAVIFMLLGAGAYRIFGGSNKMRVALVVGVPIAANGLLEIIVGSDPAYPYVRLLLAIPYAIAFGIGATVMAMFQRIRGDPRPSA